MRPGVARRAVRRSRNTHSLVDRVGVEAGIRPLPWATDVTYRCRDSAGSSGDREGLSTGGGGRMLTLSLARATSEPATDPRSSARRPLERSRLLGQVSTPARLAAVLCRALFDGRPETPISVLEPAVGEGNLLASAIAGGHIRDADSVLAVDVDAGALDSARRRLPALGFEFRADDYLLADLEERFDYVILNPPWVRQEWIDLKEEYRQRARAVGAEIPGTSNLYVYFIVKAVSELKPSGVMAALIYDSWKATRYGSWLRNWLSTQGRVEWIEVPRQPFEGRLVDASIVVVRRGGASLGVLTDHQHPIGFTPLGRLVTARRGLRLKQSSFFLTSSHTPGSTPFIKKPGRITRYQLPAGHAEGALLLERGKSDAELVGLMNERLTAARTLPHKNRSILNWAEQRPSTWFLHPRPPTAPILFNYFIRNDPVHFLSHGKPYSDNFYGVRPLGAFATAAVLAILNGHHVREALRSCARNQGNGLLKLQLFEYREVPVPDWRLFSTEAMEELARLGRRLIDDEKPQAMIHEIDRVVSGALSGVTGTARRASGR